MFLTRADLNLTNPMHSTLTESLDLLLPNLVPTLVKPDAVLGLKALANNLAPILRGGFECRLSANSPQVDLQQCIVREERELALLREFIAATDGGVSAHPGWSQLQNFLAEWSEPLSLLHNSIPEIWLEFDINNSAVKLPLPAIFFGLPQDVSPAVETYAIATKSLNLLLGSEGWCEWQSNLDRCFGACPDGVFVSHIGVMLSRNAPALRVNVKRLQPDLLIPYLQEIGWQGETQELEALMKQLFALVDRITVCLDVGKRIYPQIGLECILLDRPQRESAWEIFLDYLVARGLCAPEKRDALLNWPGQTTPVNSPVPWPDRLIAASLLQPRERFTIFDRQLSHIKIVYGPEGQLEAKAYLWFEHKWLSRESKNMQVKSEKKLDLDRFYSTESIAAWKEIIGEDLHYHFGYFRGSEDLETGLRQTVRNYYDYITPGARVLDIGCGWGGPAKMLIAERNCAITGISSSSGQVSYCRSLGLNVWQQDLEQELDDIPGEYDIIFSLEMISHIRNKAGLLRRLRARGSRLILSGNCAADGYSGDRTSFGGSMVLCSVSELVRDVSSAGWKIQFMEDRRFPSLRTIALWKENLDRVYGDREPPGQLNILKSLVDIAMRSPIMWGKSFPLIDIVAD